MSVRTSTIPSHPSWGASSAIKTPDFEAQRNLEIKLLQDISGILQFPIDKIEFEKCQSFYIFHFYEIDILIAKIAISFSGLNYGMIELYEEYFSTNSDKYVLPNKLLSASNLFMGVEHSNNSNGCISIIFLGLSKYIPTPAILKEDKENSNPIFKSFI